MSTNWITLREAPYRSTLQQQKQLFDSAVELRRRGLELPEETVMLVEHLPVYTLGRHGHRDDLLSPELLSRRGAELVEIDRGGDITYHGPGQLVVYPIIDLRRHLLGVKAYIDRLEEAVIQTVGSYGIAAGRVEGATGVWVGISTPRERKICAIGVKCSRFVTMHGLALNVNTDLSWFAAINPCGFTDRGVTSMAAELGRDLDWDEVAATLRRNLSAQLGLP